MRAFVGVSSIVCAVGGCLLPSQPAPSPLSLERAPWGVAPEPCKPHTEEVKPSGQTPAPRSEGELGEAKVEGDDRFAVVGSVVFGWSHDGERILSLTTDQVLVWSASTGQLLRSITLDSRLTLPAQILESPDGNWIAIQGYAPGFAAPEVRYFRSDGKRQSTRFFGHPGALSFSDDSRTLATPSHRWTMATGAHEAVQIPPLNFPPGTALSGDGKRRAVLADHQLRVYSTERSELVAHLQDTGHAGMVHLSHDGKQAVLEVFSCSSDESPSPCPPPELTVWDLDLGKQRLRQASGSGRGWSFSRDGAYLVGTEGRIENSIVRIEDGKNQTFGHVIRSVAPDSRRLIFADSTGLKIASLDEKSPVPDLVRVPRVVARSKDGRFRATIDQDARLRVESATSCLRLGVTTDSWRGPSRALDYLDLSQDQLAFSADGSSLVVVHHANSMHAQVRAYDTATGVERWGLRSAGGSQGSAFLLPAAEQVLFQSYKHPSLIRFRAFSGELLPAGKMPRVGDEQSITGAVREVRIHEGDRAGSLHAPVSDRLGARLAMTSFLGGACFLSVWNLHTPRHVRDIPIDCDGRLLGLSSEERWLVLGEQGGGLRLFNWRTLTPRGLPEKHSKRATSVAFSPADQRMASASEDGSILLIDPRDGSIKGRAWLPLDHAKNLWFSPDGQALVADTARGLQVTFPLRPA